MAAIDSVTHCGDGYDRKIVVAAVDLEENEMVRVALKMDFRDHFVRLYRCRVRANEKFLNRDFPLPLRTTHMSYCTENECAKRHFPRRISLYETAADGPAITHLAIANMADHLREQGQALGDKRIEFDTMIAHARA